MNFERKCSVMGRKMKFGCLVKKGVAEVRERDLPEVGPYDVLLHMKVCNICTTDYGQWLGLREHQGYPMAGGHEAAGIVEQVGEKVTDLKVGDMVATGYEDADIVLLVVKDISISVKKFAMIQKMDINGDSLVFQIIV